MFAALHAPSLPAAALVDVARAFTPRFEQIGSIILLDASGLSRLFGSAQELGEHLRDAIQKQAEGLEGVESVATLAGTNILSDGTGATYGTALVNLKPWHEREASAPACSP